MATIVNTPAQEREGAGTGVIVGILLALLLAILLLAVGLPYLQSRGVPATPSNDAGVSGSANFDVNLPDSGASGNTGGTGGEAQ